MGLEDLIILEFTILIYCCNYFFHWEGSDMAFIGILGTLVSFSLAILFILKKEADQD
jgi:hypothetical protein